MSGKTKIQSLREKLLKHTVVAVDSSVFIYQFETVAPYFTLTNTFFTLFSDEKISLVTSAITLAEILTKPYQNGDQANIFLLKDTFARMTRLKIVPMDQNLAEASAFVRAKYHLRLPDAIQVAAAMYSKTKVFVTNDIQLKKIKDIDILVLKDYV